MLVRVRVRDDGVTYTHSRPVAGGPAEEGHVRSGLFFPLSGLLGYGRCAGLKSGAIRTDPGPGRKLGWPDTSINCRQRDRPCFVWARLEPTGTSVRRRETDAELPEQAVARRRGSDGW